MNKIINTDWTQLLIPKPEKPVDVSKLTEDEQADLIVKKLSTQPINKFDEHIIMELLAQTIANEIDTEILKGTY